MDIDSNKSPDIISDESSVSNTFPTVKYASMGMRLLAYFIDRLVKFVVVIAMIILAGLLLSILPDIDILNLILLSLFVILILATFILFDGIITWYFNGLTLGKKLLKLRVVRLDRSDLTFWDAFLREVLIKRVANNMLFNMLNVVSFIYACISPEQRAIHDLAAKTIVISTAKDK